MLRDELKTRVLLSLVAVAAVTGVVFALRPVAPVLSLGVLYLLAVLPVAVAWGLAYAVPVSVVSLVVFNFLFLPPVHTLALRDSENWVALAVYLATAIVVSELATRSRRRAASDAVKTTLLRTLSHDLRSPLTGIAAASEVLESGGLGEGERAELVASIRHETARLSRLVANLLDLSRLEAGAAVPRAELWTADGLVVRALEAIGRDATRVAVSLPDDSPAVEIDATQMERVLVNLLENALNASSPTDGVELIATVERARLVIRIVDHGPGIAAGDLSRIFEPFERGRDESGVGSGLGLAIARGFTETNGGKLVAETQPGRGATFVLTLPVPARTAVSA